MDTLPPDMQALHDRIVATINQVISPALSQIQQAAAHLTIAAAPATTQPSPPVAVPAVPDPTVARLDSAIQQLATAATAIAQASAKAAAAPSNLFSWLPDALGHGGAATYALGVLMNLPTSGGLAAAIPHLAGAAGASGLFATLRQAVAALKARSQAAP